MMGMFLAALDQTVVSTAMRTIADDLRRLLRCRPGRPRRSSSPRRSPPRCTASCPTSTAASRSSCSRSRSSSSARRCAGCRQSMYQLAGVPGACRASAPAACCRWRWPSSATSCRPASGPSTRATSWPSSAPPACSGPCSAASSPAPDTILGIAGWRWIFYINVPIALAALLVVSRVLHIPHTPQDHRIDWPGALRAGRLPRAAADRGRAGPRVGLGLGPRAGSATASALLGLVAFILAERWYGDEALLPLRLFRGRTFAVGSVSSFDPRHGHVRRPADPAAVPADRQGRHARPRPACS